MELPRPPRIRLKSGSYFGPNPYWPPEAPNEETLSAFVAAYATVGYSLCQDGKQEEGFEKIAIYADPSTGTPTHAAHQLVDGRWESKLGSCVDIQHDLLSELTESRYGDVVCYMKRPIRCPKYEQKRATSATREPP